MAGNCGETEVRKKAVEALIKVANAMDDNTLQNIFLPQVVFKLLDGYGDKNSKDGNGRGGNNDSNVGVPYCGEFCSKISGIYLMVELYTKFGS